jgi:APA family basic amino acid/polyamine antiporter
MSGDGEGAGALRAGALGAKESLLLCIGGMVGIAIFTLSSTTFALCGPSAVLAWAAAGALMLAIGLNFAELASAFPRAGGVFMYPREALGRYGPLGDLLSFLSGWIYWFTFGVLANVIGAEFVGQYLSMLLPSMALHPTAAASAALALVFALNLLGIRIAGIANAVLTSMLVSIMAIYSAFALPRVDLGLLRPFLSGQLGLRGFFISITVAWLGYTAWMAITSVAEEVRDPKRTVPRALSASISIVALLYVSALLATVGNVRWEELTMGNPEGFYAPFALVAAGLGLPWLRGLVYLAGVLAILTTMLVLLMDGSRVLYAMGKHGALPKAFALTNRRFGTPWASLAFLAAASVALLAQPPSLVYYLIQMGGANFGLIIAIDCACLLHLKLSARRAHPSYDPEYRVPGGPALPILAIAVIALAMSQYDMEVYRLTLGWIGAGMAAYALRRALGHGPDRIARSASVRRDFPLSGPSGRYPRRS